MRHVFLAATIVLVVCTFFLTGPAIQAQPYPNRPVQFVIPGTAGSVLDVYGRVIGDELGKILETQFVPTNRPGASFTLGTDLVVKSKKDGYTLLYANTSAIIYTRVTSQETVPYDPSKDLEPLGLHLFFPLTVTVQEGSPWKTFEELIDFARKNPEKLRVSTAGQNSMDYFNLEITQAQTGARFSHVPFKGGPEANTALMGGHVEVNYNSISTVRPHVESGKLRVLLVTRKTKEFPAVPTLTELGYKQDLLSAWFALYGPAGIPDEVKKVLIPAIEKAAKNPELKAKLEKLGCIVDYKSPAELRKIMTEDYERAMAIATKIGLRK